MSAEPVDVELELLEVPELEPELELEPEVELLAGTKVSSV